MEVWVLVHIFWDYIVLWTFGVPVWTFGVSKVLWASCVPVRICCISKVFSNVLHSVLIFSIGKNIVVILAHFPIFCGLNLFSNYRSFLNIQVARVFLTFCVSCDKMHFQRILLAFWLMNLVTERIVNIMRLWYYVLVPKVFRKVCVTIKISGALVQIFCIHYGLLTFKVSCQNFAPLYCNSMLESLFEHFFAIKFIEFFCFCSC